MRAGRESRSCVSNRNPSAVHAVRLLNSRHSRHRLFMALCVWPWFRKVFAARSAARFFFFCPLLACACSNAARGRPPRAARQLRSPECQVGGGWECLRPIPLMSGEGFLGGAVMSGGGGADGWGAATSSLPTTSTESRPPDDRWRAVSAVEGLVFQRHGVGSRYSASRP